MERCTPARLVMYVACKEWLLVRNSRVLKGISVPSDRRSHNRALVDTIAPQAQLLGRPHHAPPDSRALPKLLHRLLVDYTVYRA